MTKINWPVLISVPLMMLNPAYADEQNVIICKPDQNISWISDTSLIGLREHDGIWVNQPPPYIAPWETSETEGTLALIPVDAEAELTGMLSVHTSNITHRIVGSTDWVDSSISCSIGRGDSGVIFGLCYESGDSNTRTVIEIWQPDWRSQIEYIYRSPELDVPIFGLALDAPRTILEYGRCERL